MAGLRDISDGLAGAVARVAPAVVAVHGRRHPTSGVVWSADRVVTVAQGVRREGEVTIRLPDGSEREASVVGKDPATDLALLSVVGDPLPGAPSWADAAGVKVGALVVPVGRRGRGIRAVLGIVGEVGPAWQTIQGGTVDAWIDVDASLPIGFEGGPLVDADGAVIGINTSGLTQRGAVLPRATVERVVQRLEAHGTAAPGYLGAGFYPGTLPDDLARSAGQVEALMAVSLEPGGPGAKAGLLVGDALVRLDGQSVTGIRHLLALLGAKGAGTEVTLTVLRAGTLQDVKVTLGARPRPASHCG